MTDNKRMLEKQKSNAQKTKRNLECIICLNTLDSVDELCPNRHAYCIECLNLHFENMLISKNVSIKCTLCKENFYDNKLKAYLNEDVQSGILKLNIFSEFPIPENCHLMKCPQCPDKYNPGMILIDVNDSIQFYKCENSNCLKTICLYCFKVYNAASSNHADCKTNYKVLLDLQKVISHAMSIQCPKCKIREIITNEDITLNIKDYNCTHIKCNKCNMNFCYVCGGHEEVVDKSNVQGSTQIYRHNRDWETMATRCPMYLKDFHTKISEWPKDEAKATAEFYDYKLESYLKKVIDKHGIKTVKLAFDIFKEKRLIGLSADYFNEGKSKIISGLVKHDLINKKIFNMFDIN